MDIDFATRLMHRDTRLARPRAVAAWLFVCCALVFALVVVGGVTRLVQIGLGVGTLVLVVPVHLAACHQAGAVVVFACALFLAHAVGESKVREVSQ
jgi:heme A synthase